MDKNVLLICSDMVGARHLGCYGDPVGATPHIDQLAANGTRFEAAYCATTPCIPARISMMSGQYAHTHGKLAHMKMPLEPRPPLLPEILTQNGYQTAMVGKTHFWPSQDTLGFQEAHLTIDTHLTPELGQGDAYIQFLQERDLFTFNAATWDEDRSKLAADNLPDDALKVNWTGDTACNILDSFATQPEQPFFLYVSFVEPHGPGCVKSDLWDEYAARPIPEMIPVGDSIPPTQKRAVERWDTSQEDQERYRSGVYASLSLVDDNIGKLLDRLESLGLRESTVIIFLTDHGELMYDHGCIEKTFLYEPAANIPWIMSGPGIPAGETRSHFVSQVDLLPTILDVCGIDAPSIHIEGHSLLPILTDPSTSWRDAVFCEVEQSVHLRDLVKSSIAKMIRRGVWKYIYTLIDGETVEEELYHLADDPDELVNLAHESTQQTRIQALRAEILNWLMRGEVNRLHPAPENHYPIPKVSENVFF